MKCEYLAMLIYAVMIFVLSLGFAGRVYVTECLDPHLDATPKPTPNFNTTGMDERSKQKLSDRIEEPSGKLFMSNGKVPSEMDKIWCRIVILTAVNAFCALCFVF